MSEPTNAVARTPEFALHRHVVVNDGAVSTEKKHGMNLDGFRYAVVQVVPSSGANPVAEVLFWSEAAGTFVQGHTALSFAAAGADTPWMAEIEVNGQIIWVELSSGVTGGEADVYIGGAAERPR